MDEMKSVRFEICYAQMGRSCEIKVRREASVNFGTDTTFASIAVFLADMEKCMAAYRHCSKNGLRCKAYLYIGAYERQADGQFVSRSFNGWEFEDIPEYECAGFYLHPDERYTNEDHDIWIDFSLPLLDQLAEAKI